MWQRLFGDTNVCRIQIILIPSNQNGFAVKTDAGTLCTSLVREMLNVHLKDLWDDGFIDDLWSYSYGQKHDIFDETCFTENVVTTASSSDTMNLTNIGGIFLVHLGLLVVSFFVYLFERQIRKRKKLIGRDSTKADILRHSEFQRRSLYGNYADASSDTVRFDNKSSEESLLSVKVDVIESKVFGIEDKVQDLTNTMAEMMALMKQQQAASYHTGYAKQETFGTTMSSTQNDLDADGEYDERFDDDNFSYDTNAVFR